jgi:low affinity Fe/Cu permease
MNRTLNKISRFMEHFAQKVAHWAGSSWAFSAAVSTIVIWAALGPQFGYSDTWQLVINTGTTIITFLMVFLIQRSQNKDALAIQLKLNELVAALQGASNRLISVEQHS